MHELMFGFHAVRTSLFIGRNCLLYLQCVLNSGTEFSRRGFGNNFEWL